MKKLSILLLTLLMVMPGVLAATRTFSSTTVTQGGTLGITYNADITTVFKQPIPAGWVVTNTAGGAVTDGTLRLFGTSATIQLRAPNIDQSYNFGGEWATSGDDTWTQFSTQSITVGGGGVCTPNWDCGDWSSCVDSEMSRTCNDGCGDSRTETQSCGTPGTECTPGQTWVCTTDYGCIGAGTCDANGNRGACIANDPLCVGTQEDSLCQYFEWAPSLGGVDGCIVGIIIVIIGLIVFSKLMGK